MLSEIKSHWRAHLPRMYRRLQKSGELDGLADSVAASTREYARTLHQRQGLDPYTAWSDAMREVALNLYS
ncbi:MAG: hypothetical protein AVDCRST_MAG77-3094 [uncultured Chloroflexi bacterium]|uniref:Uncharacterized protein n=1 Tax=uncultured Chloroflexota bacterium TaxID=166587 RepID=A0A6J4J6H3_9CHLR|nr:MAG: hypothetical protein AVDCRST_MAG77-3094 [uncultured Chloroflexota bacterium]